MAERLKKKLLEADKTVDLIAGPGMCIVVYKGKWIYPIQSILDSYRDLPRLLSTAKSGQQTGYSVVIVSLVPRPLPRFQCYTQKRGKAWYLKSRA